MSKFHRLYLKIWQKHNMTYQIWNRMCAASAKVICYKAEHIHTSILESPLELSQQDVMFAQLINIHIFQLAFTYGGTIKEQINLLNMTKN